MAIEWYLMNTNHDTISGFESENYDEMAQDAFEEALNSSLGIAVEICNHDLSVRTPCRIIMQGNLADTKLNAMSRRVIAKIGTYKLGSYVYYKNRYWLIVGLPDDNGVYEKFVITICNFKLAWKNAENAIIQRWINVSSASQYNNGETSERYMTLRTDQIMALMPRDDECLLIPHGERFIIDARCKIYEKEFKNNIISDTSKPLIIYKLTRMDNVFYDYQDCGHFEFLGTQDEKHEHDGYYVVDGHGYWLCDPVELIENKTDVLSSSIECDEPVIYCGLEPSLFMAKFVYASNAKTVITPQWGVECDFIDKLNIEYIDNAIYISTNDNKLINKSFVLTLSADGYEKSSAVVTIKAFI